jgi:hypothetical protein
MRHYNNRFHGTIKCTPEEAFQGQYKATPELKDLSKEEIRQRVVENTKLTGQKANQGHIVDFKVGDKILLRDKLKTKVRHDG